MNTKLSERILLAQKVKHVWVLSPRLSTGLSSVQPNANNVLTTIACLTESHTNSNNCNLKPKWGRDSG
jgi:hypothetical protein